MSNIDLRTCKPGDILIGSRGSVYEYVQYLTDPRYKFPHEVKYLRGHPEEYLHKDMLKMPTNRFDNGRVWEFEPDTVNCGIDEDIVEIIHKMDLRTCKPGDILISRLGATLEYVKYEPSVEPFPHRVKYIKDKDGNSMGEDNLGTRTEDGYVWRNEAIRNPEEDHDIVEIQYK